MGVTGASTLGSVSASSLTVSGTGTVTGNLTVGNITATTGLYGTFYGTVAGASTSSNVASYITTTTSSTNSTNYLVFSNATTGNLAPITNSSLTFNPGTGLISTTSITATNGTFTYITPTNVSTANAVITGGSINSTVIGGTSAAAGTFTNLTATNVTGTNVTGTYVTATNFSSGNAQITGGSLTGITIEGVTTLTATNFSSGNAQISGGSVNGAPVGNATPSTGAFTTLSSSGAATLNSASVTTTLAVTGTSTFTANATFTNGVTINNGQAAGSDLYVKGKQDTTLIWAHAATGYDTVIIGNSATTGNLVTGAKLIVNSTDSVLLPVGSNAQRPGNAGGTDVAGMIRYNNASNAVEFFNGNTWTGTGSTYSVITDQQITADGTTSTWTLTGNTSTTTAATIVSINGVVQIPTVAYAINNGNSLAFTETPSNGDIIDVRVLSTQATITALASVNGYMQVSVNNNGVYIGTGTSSVVNTTSWDPSGAQVSSIANVSVASANSATTIDTMDTTTYRSAKYVVQVSNGANYQVMEALLISNGTTATVTTYGTINTGGNLGVLSATQSGNNATLQFVAANATNNVRIKKDYLLI